VQVLDSLTPQFGFHVLGFIHNHDGPGPLNLVDRDAAFGFFVDDFRIRNKRIDVDHHDLERVVPGEVAHLNESFGIIDKEVFLWIIEEGGKVFLRDLEVL